MENITALYRNLLEARQRQTAARLAWRKARRSNRAEADARRRDYQLITQLHRQLLTKITAGLEALTDPSDQRFLDWPLLNHQRAYPFLLAPVRLETRFQKRNGQNALLVRIYPDTCSINTVDLNTAEKAARRRAEDAGINPFIPELTAEEIQAARQFWRRYWTAGDDDSVQRAAWKEIAGAYGSGRAHWVLLQHPILQYLGEENGEAKLQFPEQAVPEDQKPELETYAQLLPDFFVLFAERRAKEKPDQEKDYFKVVRGKPIAKPVAVSPFQSADGDLWESEEIRWMADFDEAVEKGMAIILTDRDAQEDMQKGFDRIFVLGVRLMGAPEIARVELAQLFAAHYASRAGFEILPQGTPTNNTEETGAGYARRDDADAGFDRLAPWLSDYLELVKTGKKIKLKPERTDLETDGASLEKALGFPAGQLQYTPKHNGTDQHEAILMNRLLYPGTLGYYLNEMMKNANHGEPPLLQDDPFIQEFFQELVRGRGTLPAVRIGRQPYGILPTMAFSTMKRPEDPQLSNLYQILCNLYSKGNPDFSWSGALADKVPHLGQEAGVTAEIILQMLGLHAGSAEFYKRRARESGSVEDIPDDSDIHLLMKALKRKSVREKRESEATEEVNPRILKLRYADHDEVDNGHWLLNGPVIDDKPLSETETVNIQMKISPGEESRGQGSDEETTNYLQWLSDHVKNWQEFTVEFPGHEKPPLLYQLITWSLQQNNTIAQGNALTALAQCPTARLDRLLSEHLDCLSYRLDAWISGLISRQIKSMREEHPTGIHLGAYGWVEKVKPKPAPRKFDEVYASKFTVKAGMGGKEHGDTAQALNLRDLHDNPVFVDGANAGYIHTPSLNQGVTAALLRSGAVSNGDSADPGPYAVNLSSKRVRRALTIVEGIRQGQDPGALLGYQLERFLHDAHDQSGVELDQYIYPLRRAFPIRTSRMETPESEMEEATEMLSARNVIDGLKLIRALESSDLSHEQFVVKYIPELVKIDKKEEREAMAARMERLQDTFDGLADLALAESVHHAAQGNYERAGAHLDAYSRGGYPPEHELIRTSRSVSYRDPESTNTDYQTGVTLTHRVALHLDPNADAGATPRAMANPALNQWLSGILPEMSKIHCQVIDENQPGTIITLSMTDLGLEPIDLLYMQPASLEELAIYAALEKNANLKLGMHLRFDPSPMEKLHPLLRTLRKLILKARPIEPADLGLNKEEDAVQELKTLKAHWVEVLKCKPALNEDRQKILFFREKFDELEEEKTETKKRIAEIEENIPIRSEEDVMAIPQEILTLLWSTVDDLRPLSYYGMSQTGFGFVFDLVRDREESLREIRSAYQQQEREEKEEKEVLGKKKELIAQYLRILIAALQRVGDQISIVVDEINALAKTEESNTQKTANLLFGEAFVLLPSFAPADNWKNAPEITYYDPDDPENENPNKEFILDDWLHGVARVREKMGQWEKLTFLVEALGKPLPALTTKQLGPDAGKKNYWLAAEYPEDHRVQGDYLLYTYAGETTGNEICGLLLDEWTEIIPGDTEVTGLAFHFDRPNAEAPQALLLVAPTQFDGAWTLSDLLDALRETLQMAKNRAVEPDQLLGEPYAQLLPAVFMDFEPSILE